MWYQSLVALDLGSTSGVRSIVVRDEICKDISSRKAKFGDIVWMNKPEVKTMNIDDLYNNFKIVEQKVNKIVGTSSGGQNLAFMIPPSSSSTNDANTTCLQVSAASPSVNTASPQVCTASVSDNTVYAFMVENPNGSNVLHQDLEQIHEDDLEAMDLKWECRAPRSKECQFRNHDNTRKHGNNEDTSKAMLDIDGVGFDWSDMEEEQVQTNMALMAFSDSRHNLSHIGRMGFFLVKKLLSLKEMYECKTLFNNIDSLFNSAVLYQSCLKNYETLKKRYDDLLAKLHQTEFKATTYKRGLDIVTGITVTYRKNGVLFGEEVVVLKRDV
ncbi:hypothetical protein Tco_1394196 [Tanacetum coccineum]